MQNTSSFDQVRQQLERLGCERADVVVSLVPDVPAEVLPEMVCWGLNLYGESQREVLLALAERLKREDEAVQRRALIALRSMDVMADLGSAADFVTELAPHLAEPVLPWAVETALRAGYPLDRVPLLLRLCERICPQHLTRFVEHLLDEWKGHASSEHEAWFWDEEMLLGIAVGVPVEMRAEVVALSHTLENRALRAAVLLRLGLHWGREELELLAPQALDAWRMLGDDTLTHSIDLRELIDELPAPWREAWRDQVAAELLQQEPGVDDSARYFQREAQQSFWWLLSEDEQHRYLLGRLEFARQAPEQDVKPDDDVFAGQKYSPRLDALEELPALPETLAQEALEIVRSLSDPATQLRALEHLATVEAPAPSIVAAFFELVEAQPVRGRVVNALTAVTARSQGELQHRAARTLLDVLKELDATVPAFDAASPEEQTGEEWTGELWDEDEIKSSLGNLEPPSSDRASALRELGYSVPSVLAPEVVRAVLALPDADERRRLSLNLLRHLAPKWPESVLVLLPVIGDGDDIAYDLSWSWKFLPDDIREALNSTVWRIATRSLSLLRQGVEDEERRGQLEGVLTTLFECLWPEQQSSLLLGITELENADELLLSLLRELPREWQVYAARRTLQSETLPEGWGDRGSVVAYLLRYLPLAEQPPLVQEQFDAIQKAALEYLDDRADEDTEEQFEADQNEWLQSGKLSFWADSLHLLRRLLPYARETQLRQLIAWLKSLPTTAEFTQSDAQLSQGSLWSKEEVLALALLTLARQVNDANEVRSLLIEALELAFYHPYYPEIGGDGGEPEPQGVDLTVEQVNAALNSLDADGRRVLIRHLMGTMAERDAGELVSIAHEAVRRVEGEPVSATSETATLSSLSHPSAPQAPANTTPPLYLQGQLPTQAQVGEVLNVQVRLAPQQGELSARLREVPLSTGRARITLLLHAPDFEVLSSRRQEVEIGASNTSSWVAFELRSFRQGRCPITVSAFHGGTHLGELTATVEVVEVKSLAFEQQPEANLESRAATPGEMTWWISYDEKERRFQFFFFEPGGGTWQGCSATLTGALGTMTERLIEGIEEVRDSSETTVMRRDLLAGLGADLWSQCLPVELQEVLVQRSDGLRRLQIISQGEAMPWEALCPPEVDAKAPLFLAERFPIYRWVPGAQAPNLLTWQKPSFVLIDPAEPSMMTELQNVRRWMSAFREDVPDPVRSSEQLMERLKRGDFDWLHFIGHHAFSSENPALSRMRLGPHFFRAAYLGTLKNRWRAHRPLVFFNACRTAGAAPLYTNVDGWASRCITAGAAAFVGTHWEVVNHPAHHFADAFYEALSRQHPLADAFYTARLATRDAHPDDFSWLAYVLYGNADAKVLPMES